MREVKNNFTIVPAIVIYTVSARLRGRVRVENIYLYASNVKSRIKNPLTLDTDDVTTYQKGIIHINADMARIKYIINSTKYVLLTMEF